MKKVAHYVSSSTNIDDLPISAKIGILIRHLLKPSSVDSRTKLNKEQLKVASKIKLAITKACNQLDEGLNTITIKLPIMYLQYCDDKVLNAFEKMYNLELHAKDKRMPVKSGKDFYITITKKLK